MKRLRPFLLVTAIATLFAAEAGAAERVVASIKPVHSLVAAVMEGVGTPELLVKGAASPHVYSLRPSEAAMLEQADIVFWVGPQLEVFLEKPLGTLTAGAKVVELSEAPGLTLLAPREGGAFEAHTHEEGDHHHGAEDDHHHEAHEDEERHHEAHEDEGHGEAHEDHQGEHEEGHAHETVDAHLWLDPENARAMAGQIAAALSEADPENRETYEKNAAALEARLDDLIAQTEKALEPVRGRPFIVFHDAYQYYEKRFDIPAAGSISVSPEAQPGAHRLEEIHDKIAELGAACVFSEPQFEPKLVEVVTEGTDARSGVLDPLGADIEDGPELYFTLMGRMTGSLVDCLSGGA